MAEIKFTTARMVEVRSRIDDIVSQLTTVLNEDSSTYNEIASNIQSDQISGTLKSYSEKAVETGKEIQNLMKQVDEYLATQIGSYQATDQAGQEAISQVQNILSQF